MLTALAAAHIVAWGIAFYATHTGNDAMGSFSVQAICGSGLLLSVTELARAVPL